MAERVYYHYKDLEEVEGGLWRIVRGEERERNVLNAGELMKDSGSFKEAMLRSLVEWPNSSLHNLSADGVNKLAYLGHAGCCVGVGSPEENTRCAWHTLTHDEQREADATAGEVLSIWENTYVNSNVLPLFRSLENA